MQKEDVIKLSLKLAGIYCLVVALQYITIFFAGLLNAAQHISLLVVSITVLGMLFPYLLILLLSYFLIFKTTKVTQKMKFDEAPSVEKKSSSQDIQFLAFSIIGVFLVTTALPKLFQISVRLITIYSQTQQPMNDLVKAANISDAAGLILRIILGLYLFFGSKGLVNLWHKFQNTKGMPSN